MWGFADLFNFLTCEDIPYKERLVDNTKVGRYTVDTVYATDTGLYETAIWKDKNKMIVVEEYSSKDKAKKGHNKWIDFAKTEPEEAFEIHLEEIMSFNIPDDCRI